jgi:leucyl-tRNA---protein transferase
MDALPEGVSAIYCYYDPAEKARSLGTFNILCLLASTRERGLPHVLVTTSRDVDRWEYKRTFRPNEVLGGAGSWEAFD